jgi:hypothetical protein
LSLIGASFNLSIELKYQSSGKNSKVDKKQTTTTTTKSKWQNKTKNLICVATPNATFGFGSNANGTRHFATTGKPSCHLMY